MNPPSTEEMLRHWNDLRLQDHFTDMEVYCGPNMNCIKLHSAVLAASSRFLKEALGSREKYVLMLPDVDMTEMISLVRMLYGDTKGNKLPSDELLGLLGIRMELFLNGIPVVNCEEQVVSGYGQQFEVQDEFVTFSEDDLESVAEFHHVDLESSSSSDESSLSALIFKNPECCKISKGRKRKTPVTYKPECGKQRQNAHHQNIFSRTQAETYLIPKSNMASFDTSNFDALINSAIGDWMEQSEMISAAKRKCESERR